MARSIAIARDHLRAGGPRLLARKVTARLRRRLQQSQYRFNVRRLTRRPDSVPIDRPIFLLGVQGGGGTILARCLYRHPQVVYSSGNSRHWAGKDEMHNCRHLHDLPEPLVHRSPHFGNVGIRVEHHPRYGQQRSWLYAIDEYLPVHSHTDDTSDPLVRTAFRRVLQKIILAYAQDPDNCRFVDKSQTFTVQVPLIANLLRGCGPLFIVVARNPYATCARAVRKEYGRGKGCYLAENIEQRIDCAVQHWSNSYRLALASRGTVPMLVVRYEDFVENPGAVVHRVCEFTGLPFYPRQIPSPNDRVPAGSMEDTKWYPILEGENEKYLEGIDPRIVRRLGERAGDLIDELGYPRIEFP